MTGSIPRESSAEVEQEAEDTRANLAHTLDQLRENLKPENVVDEVMTNARYGAANLMDSLWKVARDNPIPALLIGAGLALVLGLGTRRGAALGSKAGGRPGSTLWPQDRSSRSLGAQAAGAVGAAAADAATAPSTAASARWDHLGAGASAESTSLKAGAAAPTPRAASLGLGPDQGPLVAGVVGVAIGAAIGAALPVSRTETDFLGQASVSARQATRAAVQAQWADLKAAATRAVDHVRQSATDHGLSTDNFNGLVRDVGQHAKTAVHEIGDSFEATRG